jgi:hypothetical protein
MEKIEAEASPLAGEEQDEGKNHHDGIAMMLGV